MRSTCTLMIIKIVIIHHHLHPSYHHCHHIYPILAHPSYPYHPFYPTHSLPSIPSIHSVPSHYRHHQSYPTCTLVIIIHSIITQLFRHTHPSLSSYPSHPIPSLHPNHIHLINPNQPPIPSNPNLPMGVFSTIS